MAVTTLANSPTVRLCELAENGPIIVDVMLDDNSVTLIDLVKDVPDLLDESAADPFLKWASENKLGRLFIGVSKNAKREFFVYALGLTRGGPFGDETITIGGDRYAPNASVDDAVKRCGELARGMLRKAALAAAEELPEFLRGKKSVFVVVNDAGDPLTVPDAQLLRTYSESSTPFLRAINKRLGADGLWVVSASPDAWTSQRWGKICEEFVALGADRRGYTCRPANFGGFTQPSSRPTAAGVDEVLVRLTRDHGMRLADVHVLIDGGGSCTEFALEFLRERAVSAGNVTVIDPNPARRDILERIFPGINVIVGTAATAVLPGRFDVLLVNNPGDVTDAVTLERLLAAGVKVIVGAANDLFKVDEEESCHALIRKYSALALPAPLMNAGGWLYATIGMLAESAGLSLGDVEGQVESLVRRLQSRTIDNVLRLARSDETGDLDLYGAGKELIRRLLAQAAFTRLDGGRRPPQDILKQLFDVDPRGWEAVNANADSNDIWGGVPIPFLPKVLEAFKAEAVHTVLDVGFGAGRNIELMAREGFEVHGVDIAPSAVEMTRRRLAQCGLTATLVAADMLNMDHIVTGSLDAVCLLDVLGQVPDPVIALREAARVLKSGGLVALNLFTPADETFGHGEPLGNAMFDYKGTLFAYYSSEEAARIVRTSGLEIVRQQIVSWRDGPHGDFRPVAHTHVNTVIIARKPTSPRPPIADFAILDRRPALSQLATGIGNTPLKNVTLTLENGRTVDAKLKLEGLQIGGSAKTRAVLGMLVELQREGKLKGQPHFVLSTSGNLGRAAAEICAAARWRVTIVTDTNAAAENIEAARRFGAEVETVREGDNNGNFLTARLKRVRELVNDRNFIELDQYNSVSVPTAHSFGLGAEIFRDAEPDVVFVAASTGGTGAGIAAFARLASPTTAIVAVDVRGSVTFSGGAAAPRYLSGIGASKRSSFVDSDTFDAVIRVPERSAVAASHMFDRALGLHIGGSCGAVIHAAAQYLSANPDRVRPLLVLHDLGGYTSTIFNPAWLARTKLIPTDQDLYPLTDITA